MINISLRIFTLYIKVFIDGNGFGTIILPLRTRVFLSNIYQFYNLTVAIT